MEKYATDTFNDLFKAGSSAYKLLREKAIAPHNSKKLKDFGITDAAEMIGRTPQTIRNLEESNKLAQPRIIEKGKRQERIYSLEEINVIRDLLGTRPHRPENSETTVLGIVNFKGGAGKTTTGITSAQYFAKKGYKVLFIDADSQGSGTQMFGYIPDEDFSEEDTILNVLIGKSDDLSPVIRKTYWDGLDLIPANLSLYNAELIMPTQIAEHLSQTGKPLDFYNRLNIALNSIKSNYDIIIIDFPPSMGMISINGIFAANSLVVTMPPVNVDFASTIQFFKMVSEVLGRLPNKRYAFIRLLLTKFNNRQNAKDFEGYLKRFFGQYIMSNHMIESEALAKGASNMQTLYEIDKFLGSKKTHERAINCADNLNDELEYLVKQMWDKSTGVEQAA